MTEAQPSIKERIEAASRKLASHMGSNGANQLMLIVQLHELQLAALMDALLPEGSEVQERFSATMCTNLESAVADVSRPKLMVAS